MTDDVEKIDPKAATQFKQGNWPKRTRAKGSPNKFPQIMRDAFLLAATLAGNELARARLQRLHLRLKARLEQYGPEDGEVIFLEEEIKAIPVKQGGLVMLMYEAARLDPLEYIRHIGMKMVPHQQEFSGPDGEPIAIEDKTKKRYESREEVLDALKSRGLQLSLTELPDRPMRTIDHDPTRD